MSDRQSYTNAGVGERTIRAFNRLWGLVPLALIIFAIYLVYNATKPEKQRWQEAYENYETQRQNPVFANPESPNPLVGTHESRWSRWYEYEYSLAPYEKPRVLSYGSKEVKNFSVTSNQWQNTGIIVISGDLLVFRGDTNYLVYRVGESANFSVRDSRDQLYEVNPGNMWFPQKGNLWILTKGPLQNVTIEHYSYRGGKPSSLYKEETPYKKDDYSQFQKPASPIDEKTLNDGEYVHSYPLVCNNVIFQRVLEVGGREEKILVGGIYIGAWLGRYELGLIFFPEKEKFWSSYENLNGVLKNRKYLITRKVGSEIYQAEFTVLEVNDNKSAAKVEVVLRAQSSDSGQSSHESSQAQKTEESPVVGEKVKEKTQEIEEKRTEEQKTEELERNAAWRQKIHGLYREAQELIFKKDYESAADNYQQILDQDCEACGYKKYDICRKIAGIYSFYKAHEEGMTFSDLDQIEKWNRKALGYNPPGTDADGIYDQLKWAYIYRGDKEGIAKLFDGWANAVPSKRDAIMKEKERTLKNWEWYLRVYSSKIK